MQYVRTIQGLFPGICGIIYLQLREETQFTMWDRYQTKTDLPIKKEKSY